MQTLIRRTGAWIVGPHPILSFFADVLSVVAGVGVVYLGSQLWLWFKPSVTIECPPRIFSHEYVLFGNYAPSSNRVAVYVHSEDGQNKYWLQRGPVGSRANNTWAQRVRFGNPFGKGHVKEPPLEYSVTAVLVPIDAKRALPGDQVAVDASSQDALERMLREAGATAFASCHVVREPEACTYLPSITSPTQPANPREYAAVRSPVRLTWTPEIPMYMELRRDGAPVSGMSHRQMRSGESVELEPGVYEFKIKQTREADCEASVWFMVLQA